jgi:hypothetical protein
MTFRNSLLNHYFMLMNSALESWPHPQSARRNRDSYTLYSLKCMNGRSPPRYTLVFRPTAMRACCLCHRGVLQMCDHAFILSFQYLQVFNGISDEGKREESTTNNWTKICSFRSFIYVTYILQLFLPRFHNNQQVSRRAIRRAAASLPVRRGGVARQLRAVQVQPRQLHGHQLSVLRPLRELFHTCT